MNWNECKINQLVKEVKADFELIKSLIKQSDKKLITDEFSPLNKDTASTKFSNNYDSLREVLEALALQEGFKIYNQECFTGFLKEVLKLEKEGFDFDNLRRIRNSINYYGEDIFIEDARRLIKEIRVLRSRFVGLIKK